MYICHVATEFSPFAKAGGLGDVLEGLSLQQKRDGNFVEVILPKYDIIDVTLFDSIEVYCKNLWSYEDDKRYHNTVYKAMFRGLTIFLIDPDHNQYYFSRGLIYGSVIDSERFLYFCRTCVQFLKAEKKHPNILHLHDWMAAAIMPIISSLLPDFRNHTSIIYTIHNLAHQGTIHPRLLTKIGVNGKDFLHKDSMQDSIDESMINLKKGAILLSDQITTVSPSYAEEILDQEHGYHLSVNLKDNLHKLTGILNGIDTTTWNPQTDPYIFENYPSNSTFIEKILLAKAINKRKVQEKISLDINCKGPLIVAIARLTEQKGPDLIIEAIIQTLQKKGQFVLLGSFCDSHTENKFLELTRTYKDNPNVYFSFTFDQYFSHQLYAAADAIFIPSKFEPCGLVQLIAMTYGCVPIARATGGLKDTIVNHNKEGKTGFLFDQYSIKQVPIILEEVFDTYFCNRVKWVTLIKNGLNKDHSWTKPARKYHHLYEKMIEAKTKANTKTKTLE